MISKLSLSRLFSPARPQDIGTASARRPRRRERIARLALNDHLLADIGLGRDALPDGPGANRRNAPVR